MPPFHADISTSLSADRRLADTPAHVREASLQARRTIVPRSLRVRLVIVVIVIDCLAAALTGSVMIWKGRSATKLEIASAMQLAQTVVADTISLMQDAPATILLQSIDLHFQAIRHVRITVNDADGRLTSGRGVADASAADAEAPPGWFLALVTPPIERKTFPVVVRGHDIGAVTVTSAPGDEVGEAWTYAHALLLTAAVLNLAVLAALFIVFGRVLAPLTKVAEGLQDLEAKNFAVRLVPPSTTELRSITEHFNHTAEALAAAHKANVGLQRRLLTAQDDERRRTALELHDEVGPCLFALEANATSIVSQTKDSDALAKIHQRALDVVTLVERVQSINRSVLDRLRPMALGRIPLRETLVKLLVDMDSGEPGPRVAHAIGTLRDSYGFLVDLTIYRCMQEGLFNAVRHACATAIRLDVGEIGDDRSRAVRMVIADDGRGLPETIQNGLGIAGMRERVEALTGRFAIASTSQGTRLDILIPLDVTDPQEARGT